VAFALGYRGQGGQRLSLAIKDWGGGIPLGGVYQTNELSRELQAS
jgi:hypothetical protein